MPPKEAAVARKQSTRVSARKYRKMLEKDTPVNAAYKRNFTNVLVVLPRVRERDREKTNTSCAMHRKMTMPEEAATWGKNRAVARANRKVTARAPAIRP